MYLSKKINLTNNLTKYKLKCHQVAAGWPETIFIVIYLFGESICVEVRGLICIVSSLAPLCGSMNWTQVSRSVQQASLPTKSSCWPFTLKKKKWKGCFVAQHLPSTGLWAQSLVLKEKKNISLFPDSACNVASCLKLLSPYFSHHDTLYSQTDAKETQKDSKESVSKRRCLK